MGRICREDLAVAARRIDLAEVFVGVGGRCRERGLAGERRAAGSVRSACAAAEGLQMRFGLADGFERERVRVEVVDADPDVRCAGVRALDDLESEGEIL